MRIPVALLGAGAALLAGCASRPAQVETATFERSMPATINWRTVATESDRGRIRQWRAAWVRALEQARAAGHGAKLNREGRLLDPDAALQFTPPPPGAYRCRTIKVGAKAAGLLDYIAYQPFACRIRLENGLISLAKLTGSQRPIGLIFPDNQRRMIFLGTLQLGDERRAHEYGRDRERDMAGVVERIDPRRWRIAFPYPHFESTLDILELVPTGASAGSRP